MKKFLSRWFTRESVKLVPFYDAETDAVVQIPQSELSPAVMFIALEGRGNVYIDAAQARLPDALLQAPFQGELRSAIESLVRDLADVHPMTYLEWEEGFRTEPRPEREIARWLHLAEILNAMSLAHAFDPPRRRECLNLLLACLNGPRDTSRDRCRLRLLSEEQIDEAIRYWYDGAQA
jgi:hypothetical protein